MDKTVWDNSPELRATVESDLRNWAVWSFGWGTRPLGYPQEQPFSQSPKSPSPPCDVERAEETESKLVLWRLLAKECEPHYRKNQVKLMAALKLHYLSNLAAHSKAKALGVSRTQFYRLLDEAHYVFWLVS